MNAPVDNLDRRRDRNNNKEAANTSKSPEEGGSSPPPPPPPPPPQARRGRDRERDSRERRDDREFDRRGRDYYDRNRSSPPPPPPRERDYNKRGRPSPSPPPPPYRDRRGGGGHSPPPRRSPPFPPYKRSRRDDYDGRRGSPRGGFGPGDRRFYDYQGGYNREMGGRPNYPDERPHGRFFGRSAGGNQGGPSETLIFIFRRASFQYGIFFLQPSTLLLFRLLRSCLSYVFCFRFYGRAIWINILKHSCWAF